MHQQCLRLVAWSCNGRVSDLLSEGRGFDFWSGHYKVVSTRMGDCLRTGKPFRYIVTNSKVNLAFRFLLDR